MNTYIHYIRLFILQRKIRENNFSVDFKKSMEKIDPIFILNLRLLIKIPTTFTHQQHLIYINNILGGKFTQN